MESGAQKRQHVERAISVEQPKVNAVVRELKTVNAQIKKMQPEMKQVSVYPEYRGMCPRRSNDKCLLRSTCLR